VTSFVFPETYDELAILAHYGATPDELARRLAEREHMGVEERFRADSLARAHVGPTLADHRERWGIEPAPQPETAPGSVPGDDLPAADGDDEEQPRRLVPNGTMANVLNWVGADPTRAIAAIAAERTRDDPRTSLLRTLGKIADG
jgi:hypothetical protein